MDFGLILWGAAGEPSAWSGLLSGVWRFALVLLGINALIIVHEFGHFIVARMCGVRCDKFYIWFDAWGFKFFHFKWGDTEYGLGWLPLGGYVKMLGQEDNPAGIKEEIERAKQDAEAASENGTDAAERLAELEKSETDLYAPDSFLSKNVFQRMAIISAGVVMNVLFAILCATAAFVIGFPQNTSRIGAVLPATPAWEAGIRPGDLITGMDGKKVELFAEIPNGLLDGKPVDFQIERPGAAEPLAMTITPLREKDGLLPTIGIVPAASLALAELNPPYETSLLPEENQRFAELFGQLNGGDQLVAMNGQPVETPADYERLSRRVLTEPITFNFLPKGKKREDASAKLLSITVPPTKAMTSGIRLTMGEITAIQTDSPAAKAGMKKRTLDAEGKIVEHGDVILAINGESVLDPVTLPYRLFQSAAKEPTPMITVQRNGETVDLPLTLSPNQDYTGFLCHDGQLACDALGICYQVLPVISGTDPSVRAPEGANPVGAKIQKIGVELAAPAEGASEDVVAQYNALLSVGVKTEKGFEINAQGEDASKNADFVLHWFASQIGSFPPGTRMTVTAEQVGGGTIDLESVVTPSSDVYLIDRGLFFATDTLIFKEKSIGVALSRGWNQTADAMGSIFRVLRNIGRNVSAKAFSGPVMIVNAAWKFTATNDGLFLIFLCVIGANLAVINILPIPVLDGGHLVFLLYEAIFRRPPNENVQVILSFIGLGLLLMLMVWVIFLDIARIAGWI